MKQKLSFDAVHSTQGEPFLDTAEVDELTASFNEIGSRLNGLDCWKGRKNGSSTTRYGSGANDTRIKPPGMY